MKVSRRTVERLFCAVLPTMLDRGEVYGNIGDADGVKDAIVKSMQIAEQAAIVLTEWYGTNDLVEVRGDDAPGHGRRRPG